MSRVIVTYATPKHAAALLPHVRQLDIDEWVMGMGGKTLRAGLKDAMRTSPISRVALHGKSHTPFAMWGAARHGPDPEVGLLWALGTDDMSTMGRAVQRHWVNEMAMLHAVFPKLACAVWERNANHVKWLRVMGFTRVGDIGGTAIPLTIYTRERT